MRRILTLFVIVFMALPASAQLLINDDFEDGTYEGWKVWKNEKNTVAGADCAYNSKHAYQIGVGTFVTLRDVKPNSTYRVSFYVRSVAPQGSSKISISRYDVNQKKMSVFQSEFIQLTNTYKRVSFKFDVKKSITHRVNLIPVEDSGEFVVDNFVVEQLPQ